MFKNLFLFILFVAGFNITSNAQSSITVTINNIDPSKGNVELSLYNQAEAFPHNKGRYKAGTVSVTGNSATYQFKNIPNGDYAIALYHDVNTNSEMDKNIFGIPKEPYGFSNNVVPKMSAPKFQECMFNVKGGTSVSISLIN